MTCFNNPESHKNFGLKRAQVGHLFLLFCANIFLVRKKMKFVTEGGKTCEIQPMHKDAGCIINVGIFIFRKEGGMW